MFAKLSDILIRFRRDERGNVIIATALFIPAIALVSLGSLDSWQMMEQHRRMTVAGEQAAVAALRPERVSFYKRRQTAERMFLVNAASNGKLSNTKLRVRSWRKKDETFMQVTANATYKSIFGPIAGRKPQPLKIVTTAARKGSVTRIVSNANNRASEAKGK